MNKIEDKVKEKIENTTDLIKIIDTAIRLNFDSKTEVALKAGFTKQHLGKLLIKMQDEKNRISFNNILKLLNSLDYTIVLKKN